MEQLYTGAQEFKLIKCDKTFEGLSPLKKKYVSGKKYPSNEFISKPFLRIKSLLLADRTIHSKKPDEIRKRIVDLCGDIPRIELFARQRVEGWDCWGNEV